MIAAMKMSWLGIAALAAMLVGCGTMHAGSVATGACKATDEHEIRALFDRWNRSLLTGDPARVVANYAPGSILLPTVSNQVRITEAEKLDYFRKFLSKKPAGTIDRRVVRVECNSALDAGLYTFRFGDGSTVKARYTYTYAWDGKDWLITSHHSSALPEKD